MNIPIGQWSGSDAVEALHKTVEKFGEQSTKQTRQMLRLTWAIVFLTIVMLSAVIVQVILAYKAIATP